MNRSVSRGAAAAAALVLGMGQAAPAKVFFDCDPTHTQVVAVPPVPDEGSGGNGALELNDAMTALSYDFTFFGLDLDGLQSPTDPNDNVSAIHVHRGPLGTNGPIVFSLRDPNQDVDDQVVNATTGRITGVWDGTEGEGTTLQAELAFLLADGLYLDVHTFDHRDGELRGQILVVPEPTMLPLTLLAAPLLTRGRKRTRSTAPKGRNETGAGTWWRRHDEYDKGR